jgi:hypothetical protein
MILNKMACVAAQPQIHKWFTSGNRARAGSGQTLRLLRAFALVTMCTIAFFAAPVRGSERAETQTRDSCKLTGTSHHWKYPQTLILKAEESSEYSDGEFIFYEQKAGSIYDPFIIGRVQASAGEAHIKMPNLRAEESQRTFSFQSAYVPPKGAPRRNSIGCESNAWIVVVDW